MKTIETKTIICLVLMLLFLGMALMNDVLNSRLFAAFGIIFGAMAFHQLSKQKRNQYEQN